MKRAAPFKLGQLVRFTESFLAQIGREGLLSRNNGKNEWTVTETPIKERALLPESRYRITGTLTGLYWTTAFSSIELIRGAKARSLESLTHKRRFICKSRALSK